MKKILIIFFATEVLIVCNIEAKTQNDTTTINKPNPLTISGFVEAYYCYDFNQPGNNTLPAFVYTFNRHNEITINIAYLKGSYNTDRVRANLALGVGTYMNASYAAEQGVSKNIYEADAGVKLSKKKNLWIDAGVMPSHIGFESAHSPDCWTLTRSILADNSPYFESGAKLSYTSDNGKWYVSGLVLNGWQRIQRVDGNSTFGSGTQITYKPSGKVTINYSTFFGNDKPDSLHQTRHFHDWYGIFQITNKFSAIAGFDYGMEQKYKNSNDWNNWLGIAILLRYLPTNKTAIAIRAEYYMDENGVIIVTGTPNGFKTSGISANFDYKILDNVLWRVEGKLFSSKDKIFTDKNGTASHTCPMVTTSLSITF